MPDKETPNVCTCRAFMTQSSFIPSLGESLWSLVCGTTCSQHSWQAPATKPPPQHPSDAGGKVLLVLHMGNQSKNHQFTQVGDERKVLRKWRKKPSMRVLGVRPRDGFRNPEREVRMLTLLLSRFWTHVLVTSSDSITCRVGPTDPGLFVVLSMTNCPWLPWEPRGAQTRGLRGCEKLRSTQSGNVSLP